MVNCIHIPDASRRDPPDRRRALLEATMTTMTAAVFLFSLAYSLNDYDQPPPARDSHRSHREDPMTAVPAP